MPPAFKDKGNKPEKKNPPVSRERTPSEDMPDWLKRVPDPIEKQAGSQPAGAADQEQAMPDWLLELRPPSEQSRAEAGVENQPIDTTGIPDWLIASGESQEPASTEIPSMNAAMEAGTFAGEESAVPAEEESTSSFSFDAGKSNQPEAEVEPNEIPDWIKRMAPPGTDQTESRVQDLQSPEGEAGEMPDWIRQMAPPGAEQTAMPSEPSTEFPKGDMSEVPDWLQELKPPEVDKPQPAPRAESADEDWQAALRAENQVRMDMARQQNAEFMAELEASKKATEQAATQEAEASEGEPEAESAEETVPDWVHELRPPPGVGLSAPTPIVDESEREQLPDWLREPLPKTSGRPEPGRRPSAPQVPEGEPGLQIPAWMAELKPSGEGRPVATSHLEEVTETSGPLSGVHGVLPVALAVTQPHALSAASAMPGTGAQIFKAVLAGAQEAPVPAAVVHKQGGFSAAHLIYLLVLLAAFIPLFLRGDGVGLGVIPSFNTATLTPSVDFFEQMKALQPGATVLMAFDYEPGQSMEMDPIARAIVNDLARRNINIVTVSTSLTGARIAEDILNGGMNENPQWVKGTSYINIGLLPGDEKGRRALANNWLPSSQVDFSGKPMSLSPLGTRLNGWQNVALVVDLAATDDALRLWMEQVQPNVKTPFIGAVSAAVETSGRNYWNAKQLSGFLRGLVGAAEYELMIGQPAMPAHLADAQSFVVLVILGVIVVANMNALLGFIRKRRAVPAM